jgi:hypothetical protein
MMWIVPKRVMKPAGNGLGKFSDGNEYTNKPATTGNGSHSGGVCFTINSIPKPGNCFGSYFSHAIPVEGSCFGYSR